MQELIQKVQDEIQIDANGKVFFSQRAVSRITGIPRDTLQDWVAGKTAKFAKKYPQVVESYGKDGGGISDANMAFIIKYAMLNGNVHCEQLDLAFATCGIRSYFQDALNWHDDEHELPPEIIEAHRMILEGTDDRSAANRKITAGKRIIRDYERGQLTIGMEKLFKLENNHESCI